jgi:hypothetical protein
VSDSDDDELLAASKALLDLAGDQLDEAMNDLGLYVDAKQVMVRPGDTEPVLLWSGMLGRVALSDRVLNPEAVAVTDEFEQITAALSDETFEERRRKLLGDD